MHYRKPDFYDDFRCIADACPQNCCSAWQVVIDDESLARYRQMPGQIGDAVRAGIDWQEGCFRRGEGRLCAMQRPDGLCSLQYEAGEQALCFTCAQYPRHTEEYDGVRELSLALSCPEAARLLLERTEPLRWAEWDDSLPESDPDDDWDGFVYECLLHVREKILAAAQDRAVPVTERMGRLLAAARELQACADDGDIFAMEDVLPGTAAADDAVSMAVETFDILGTLEVLYTDVWPGMLRAVQTACEQPDYAEHLAAKAEQQAIACEQLLVYFLDVYFCGAYYDSAIFARTAMAVCGTLWIVMLGDACGIDLQRAARYYDREIFHSDMNPDDLMTALAKKC